MNPANPSPANASGASSHEDAPQVVVRAGKTYVCTACGTLVEIPADVVDQYVLVPPETSPGQPTTNEAPSEDKPSEAATLEEANATSNASTPTHRSSAGRQHKSISTAAPSKRTGSANTQTNQSRPPRLKRPKHPAAGRYAGRLIDGLTVPTAAQLDRAVAWVCYQLKVLDQQATEIKRLKRQLKKCQRNTSPRSSVAREQCAPNASGCSASARTQPKGREPP